VGTCVCIAANRANPIFVSNTLLPNCVELETDAKRGMEIKRYRTAGIIGWINGLQSGGGEVSRAKKGN
jgi:hypothetical protein